MIVLISLYLCEILNFIMSNFFLIVYSKYAVFSFFSMIHKCIPGYATLAYMYSKTRTHTVKHFCRLFFSSLFLKTISPVHYCRYSSITRMPWYCKFVKYIYIYIVTLPLHITHDSRSGCCRSDIYTFVFALIFFFFFLLNYVIRRFRVRYFISTSSVPALCLRTVFLYKITSLWHLLSYPAFPKRLFPNCVHATHCSQGKNEYRAAGTIYTGGWC